MTMTKWPVLKAAIAEAIKPNGNQEITGEVLQKTLLDIVSSMGENETYTGVVTPEADLGFPDGPVCCIATEPGVYVNFGEHELAEGEIAALRWNGVEWNKETIAENSAKIYIIKGFTVDDFWTDGPITLDSAEMSKIVDAVKNKYQIAVASDSEAGLLFSISTYMTGLLDGQDQEDIYLQFIYDHTYFNVNIFQGQASVENMSLNEPQSYVIRSFDVDDITEAVRDRVGLSQPENGFSIPWDPQESAELMPALQKNYAIYVPAKYSSFVCLCHEHEFDGPDFTLALSFGGRTYRVYCTDSDTSDADCRVLLTQDSNQYMLSSTADDLFPTGEEYYKESELNADDVRIISDALVSNKPVFIRSSVEDGAAIFPMGIEALEGDGELRLTVLTPGGIYFAVSYGWSSTKNSVAINAIHSVVIDSELGTVDYLYGSPWAYTLPKVELNLNDSRIFEGLIIADDYNYYRYLVKAIKAGKTLRLTCATDDTDVKWHVDSTSVNWLEDASCFEANFITVDTYTKELLVITLTGRQTSAYEGELKVRVRKITL